MNDNRWDINIIVNKNIVKIKGMSYVSNSLNNLNITSLDEEEKDIIPTQSGEDVRFKLRNDNSIVTVGYPYDKLMKYTNCTICQALTNNKWHHTNSFDLSKYRYDSFLILMRCLETGRLPTLTLDMDLEDLTDLAIYLSLNDEIIEERLWRL
jgi:hypothetical protein